ncbi:unnamed protein product [Sphagnum compactum]
MSFTSVRVDRIDLHKCKKCGIAVTNTLDVGTDNCADMAKGLLLATMRHICAADRFLPKGLWPKLGRYPIFTHKMSGKCLGIVGLGQIGLAVAKRSKAFGCKISYLARAEKSELPYKFHATVLELTKNSDMLVLTCALTKETSHLVGREVLDALGPEGFLARGLVVNEQELVKALVEERIAGAGLDVFENEPQVLQELWNMENVVLLPHMASTTRATVKVAVELIISNLDAHFSGKPLLTPSVDD